MPRLEQGSTSTMAALDNAQRQLDEFEATGSLYEKELVDGPSTERIGQLQAAVDASDGACVPPVDVEACACPHAHSRARRSISPLSLPLPLPLLTREPSHAAGGCCLTHAEHTHTSTTTTTHLPTQPMPTNPAVDRGWRVG